MVSRALTLVMLFGAGLALGRFVRVRGNESGAVDDDAGCRADHCDHRVGRVMRLHAWPEAHGERCPVRSALTSRCIAHAITHRPPCLSTVRCFAAFASRKRLQAVMFFQHDPHAQLALDDVESFRDHPALARWHENYRRDLSQHRLRQRSRSAIE